MKNFSISSFLGKMVNFGLKMDFQCFKLHFSLREKTLFPPYIQVNIVGGSQTKNPTDWTPNKKPTHGRRPYASIIFELRKNKVHPITMFTKQKSCTIIDVEKRFFFQGCQINRKKVMSFLIFDIYYF